MRDNEGRLAQLVRVLRSHRRGHWFESSIAHNLMSESRNDSTPIIQLFDYFDKLKARLVEINDRKPLFGVDEDLNIQEEIIKKQLDLFRKKFKSLKE